MQRDNETYEEMYYETRYYEILQVTIRREIRAVQCQTEILPNCVYGKETREGRYEMDVEYEK